MCDVFLCVVLLPCSVCLIGLSCMQAVETSGVHDYHGNCKLELALARNSWRVRACKLLEGSEKPTIQQIQRHLKEVLLLLLSRLRGV